MIESFFKTDVSFINEFLTSFCWNKWKKLSIEATLLNLTDGNLQMFVSSLPWYVFFIQHANTIFNRRETREEKWITLILSADFFHLFEISL